MRIGIPRLLKATFREFQDDRCDKLAAAIAYHVLFAMIPLVALMVALVGWFVRVPEIRQVVVGRVLEIVPLRQGMVIDGIRAVSEAREPLTIAGVLGLVWTAMGLFGTIRDSLNIAYDVSPRHGFVRRKLGDLGSVIGIGLLLGASILGTTALHSIRDLSGLLLGRHSQQIEFVWEGIGWVFPAGVTFVAFLLLYRYAPNVHHRLRDVWPGALAAALLFEAAKHGFALYVSHFSRYEALYGALGTVMLFLLWIYVSAVILLIGAELASEHEKGRAGTAPERPLRAVLDAGSMDVRAARE